MVNSDDNTIISHNYEEFQVILSRLDVSFNFFRLNFDLSKTHFQGFGYCEVIQIFLFAKQIDLTVTQLFDSIYQLGFYMSDTIGVNHEIYFASRFNSDSLKYELKILCWNHNNLQFSTTLIRSILLTRSVLLHLFGIQSIIDCTNLINFKLILN